MWVAGAVSGSYVEGDLPEQACIRDDVIIAEHPNDIAVGLFNADCLGGFGITFSNYNNLNSVLGIILSLY